MPDITENDGGFQYSISIHPDKVILSRKYQFYDGQTITQNSIQIPRKIFDTLVDLYKAHSGL